jgi:hypothetical protein
MMRSARVAITGLLLILTAAVSSGEDFYEIRLRIGQEAYREKRYVEAADNLRIAAFGFLQQPEKLSEALARLALAQSAAKRLEQADQTLIRFVLVERQFGVWPRAAVEEPVRAQFLELIGRRVSPETLRTLPSLAARAVPTPAAK